MAAASFDRALQLLLRHEGGYSNHPDDPGGPTKFGITIADYRRYVKVDATAADVRAMQPSEATPIYRRHYWDALRCDNLPAGVDYAVFDYGVNSGVGRAGKVLRRQLGLSDAMHKVSDDVLRAAAQRDAAQLVASVCDERLAFLKRLKTWPVFGAGWSRRVSEVRAEALRLAGAQRSRSATGAAAGGIVVAGGTLAQQVHQHGAPPVAVMAAVLVTVVLAVAFVWWRRRRTQQQGAAI